MGKLNNYFLKNQVFCIFASQNCLKCKRYNTLYYM